MKKRLVITNVISAVAILLVMLFQFVHSFEHLEQQLSQKNCRHSLTSKHQITHQHHNFDHCLLCDLQISGFIQNEIASFEFRKPVYILTNSFIKSKEHTEFFKGSQFVLRGPPVFIA